LGVSVGDELAVDHVGQASFQAPERLHRGLGLGELAAVVGAALGVVADLHDRGDVQHVVEPPVAGPGQPVSDLVSAGGVQGCVLEIHLGAAAVPVPSGPAHRSPKVSGGPTVVRDFLAAGLVDHMHLVQVPMVLGRGVRIWDGLEALDDAYDAEAVSSPSGVTHLTLTRKVVS
jgi:hypothetical protein